MTSFVGSPALQRTESIGRASAQKVFVPVLSQPSGPSQVAFPRATRALRVAGGVDMEHDARRLSPICPVGVCVEKAEISDEMFFIITSQHISIRSLIGDWRIERWFGHNSLSPCSWGVP
jgi:hypothetical protein